jgi:A/G-specific adenine glycosylase
VSKGKSEASAGQTRQGEARAASLLAWYDRHRRRLPWRALPGETPDPYAVWLSEIMLQQTTVPAVKPYYEGFLAKWPRVQDLAAAPVEDIMKAWAGLGYYSRARNLHACAKAVVDDHAGYFPGDEIALRDLPGIGPYTAAAIASIAFGRRAIVVDGNVERVVSRLFAIDTPLPAAKPLIRAATDELTPPTRAGDFAQAMMDLGATICTPKRPACALCPLTEDCIARLNGTQDLYPVKMPKGERPQRSGAAFFVRREDGAILVRTRAPRGLLGGMTEIPGSAWGAGDPPGPETAPIPLDWRRLPGTVEHVFTHFALRLVVFAGKAPARLAAPEDCRWVPEQDLDAEALPSVMRKVVALARGV